MIPHNRQILILTSLLSSVLAGVTVYNPEVDPSPTYTAGGPEWTGVRSQDPLRLNPPAPPANHVASFPVQLFDGGMDGLSQPTKGDFLGFSIELSVFPQLFGSNTTHLRPEFLNYLAALQERGGSITVRVGGNTQDRAKIVDTVPDGGIIEKFKDATLGPTATPEIHYTSMLIRAMAQVATMLNINYFFGVPFLATNLDGNASIVVREAQDILGDRLLALQLANEPDLYGHHNKKFPEYNQQNFFDDTASMIQSLPITKANVMGPSVCCFWDTNEVLNMGYFDRFNSQLKYINAMHYPDNNCDGSRVPAEEYHKYLTHQSATSFVQPYIPVAARAVAVGKPFVLLETNTASCGGFPGISDSFGASLWGTDMGLKMASVNFTNALWHIGGQNVYYNPFTPPPGGTERFRKWSTGSIYYSNIFLAEALSKSGRAQVVDLNMNNGNEFTPGYAIYEDGRPARVALINFMTDATGAHDYTANIQVGGGQTALPGVSPSRVFVKYLAADSVAEKWNITWAGQTMGLQFQADGRFKGETNVVTINCANNICPIPMKAPSAALVFFSEQALTTSSPNPTNPLNFTTSTLGDGVATIDWSQVKTSNGRNGQNPLGSTSHGGSFSGASARVSRMGSWSLVALFFSGALLLAL